MVNVTVGVHQTDIHVYNSYKNILDDLFEHSNNNEDLTIYQKDSLNEPFFIFKNYEWHHYLI